MSIEDLSATEKPMEDPLSAKQAQPLYLNLSHGSGGILPYFCCLRHAETTPLFMLYQIAGHGHGVEFEIIVEDGHLLSFRGTQHIDQGQIMVSRGYGIA